MTNFDEYIFAHAEDEEEYVDAEFAGNECPNCRAKFSCDDDLLNHVCSKGDVKEY